MSVKDEQGEKRSGKESKKIKQDKNKKAKIKERRDGGDVLGYSSTGSERGGRPKLGCIAWYDARASRRRSERLLGGPSNPWLMVARTPPPTVKSYGMMLLDDDEEYYDTEYGALREEEPG